MKNELKHSIDPMIDDGLKEADKLEGGMNFLSAICRLLEIKKDSKDSKSHNERDPFMTTSTDVLQLIEIIISKK